MTRFILCSLFVFLLLAQLSLQTYISVIEDEIKELSEISFENALSGKRSSKIAKKAGEKWRHQKEKINKQLASRNKTLDNYVVCKSKYFTSHHNAAVYRDLLTTIEEIKRQHAGFFKDYSDLVAKFQDKLNRNESENCVVSSLIEFYTTNEIHKICCFSRNQIFTFITRLTYGRVQQVTDTHTIWFSPCYIVY
uniref:Uncharacterized protein n=1 Tax=Trichobilharzia regenti TaxID=157069 RepID=A0AA85J0N8_TRIRE|nr:unnamed protein product [Trichobilharzia regenti]